MITACNLHRGGLLNDVLTLAKMLCCRARALSCEQQYWLQPLPQIVCFASSCVCRHIHFYFCRESVGRAIAVLCPRVQAKERRIYPNRCSLSCAGGWRHFETGREHQQLTACSMCNAIAAGVCVSTSMSMSVQIAAFVQLVRL